MTKEKKVYLVAFYFCMFKTTKLNYNTHSKKLLMVLKAYNIWYYYLKELELSIDVIMDYKYLEYFLTTKILSYY